MISGKEQIKKSVFLKYLLVLTTMQILVFEIIAPNVWRRSITAFPSFLFQFSSFSDGNLNLSLGTNKNLELEQMKIKNFRNNIVISFFGVVIVFLLVF